MGAFEAVDHEELLEQLGWVRALAQRLCSDADRAEDIAQETYVVALQRAPRDGSRLRQWLAKVARNIAYQQTRAAATRDRRERQSPRAAAEPSTLDTLERASVQHELATAVFRLSESHRDTILLRYFENLPQREIARRMNTTPATVNSRLTRALEQLRRELDDTHGGDRRAWIAALAPITTTALPTATSAAAPLGVLLMQTKMKLALGGLAAAGVLATLWSLLDNGPQPKPGEPQANTDNHAQLGAGTPSEATGTNVAPAVREPVAAPSANPASEAVARIVRGHVIRADGSPAAKVVVCAADDPATTAVSDAFGAFGLEVATPSGTIVTTSEDHVTVLAGVYAGNSAIDPTVVIAPALHLGGTVADEAGKPLAGAHVRLHLPDDFSARLGEKLDRTKRMGWAAETDAQGAFALPPVPHIGGSYLRASLEPLVPEVVGVPPYSEPRMYVVLRNTRPEGPIIRGRVVDPQGTAVAGARVGVGVTSSLTDEAGGFEIALLRAGRAEKITAIAKGFLPAFYAPQRDDRDQPSWPPFVELRLTGPALTISGQVLDVDGEPVPGALVWALDTSGFGKLPVQLEFVSAGGMLPPGEALELPVVEDPDAPVPVSNRMNHAKQPSMFWYYETADRDGRFSVPGLMDASYRLRAMHPKTVLTATSDPVQAGTSGAVIRMAAEDTVDVAGRVVTQEGDTLAGISVLVVCETYGGNYRVEDSTVDHKLIRHGPRTKTDAAGRFTIPGVPRQLIHLSVYGDPILPAIIDAANIDDPTDVEIVVRARYHVEVILADPTIADGVGARDENGRRLTLAKIRSGSHNEQTTMALQHGRSGVLAVSGTTHSLLLLKGEDVVDEVPVALTAGQTTVVRR